MQTAKHALTKASEKIEFTLSEEIGLQYNNVATNYGFYDLSAPARMQQKVKGELQNAAGTIKMSMQGSYIQAVEGISQSRNKSLELEGEASWTFISMDFGNVVFKAVMEGKATWTSQAVNNVLIDYGIGFGFGNINFEDREADGNKWDLKLKTNSIINTNKLESEQNGLKLDFRLKF